MAIGKFHHGLSRDEFLDMTPKFFEQLCRLHRDRVRHDEYMLAQIASVISYRVWKKPRRTEELMPSMAKLGPKLVKPMTPEEKAAKLEGTFALFDRLAGVA